MPMGQRVVHASHEAQSQMELLPGYYAWTEEHALWRYLDANAGDHYREHAEQIRQWRAGR